VISRKRAALSRLFSFCLAEQSGIGYYCPNLPRSLTMLVYKVIELGTVSEEVIEETLNEWTAKGWIFDGMQFAMRESSRRPSMAFVLFTKEGGEAAHE
jgi:hypothetical protein